MNLKTVVDSIIEALREKGLDEETIEAILNTWKSREGLEDLNMNYDRKKISSLFRLIESYYKGELVPEGLQHEEVEEIGVVDTEKEELEQSIEKELEELVRILSSSAEDVEEEMPEIEAEEEEIDEELERELREFAEFLENQGNFEEKEKAEVEVQEPPEAPTPPIKIVEEEEEKKIRSLVEKLVESTPEPIKMSDIQIRGLRLAAVISGDRVEKILVFKEGEEKPAVGRLHDTISSIWQLTGYEVHGFDSFHVKAGALILYGEKLEGKTYIVVVESETVGGAKFIVLALKKMLSQE